MAKKYRLPDGTIVIDQRGTSGCMLLVWMLLALFLFFVVLPMAGCGLLGSIGLDLIERAAKQDEEREAAEEVLPGDEETGQEAEPESLEGADE